jgi:hypothetical protein
MVKRKSLISPFSETPFGEIWWTLIGVINYYNITMLNNFRQDSQNVRSNLNIYLVHPVILSKENKSPNLIIRTLGHKNATCT